MIDTTPPSPAPATAHRRRHFRFSPKVSLTCLVLITLMVRASFWQWERHQQKLDYVATLAARLSAEPVPFDEILKVPTAELLHRRVLVEGNFDYDHEMVLRNRKLEDEAGGHLLTPLRIPGQEKVLLVDRGFAPLMELDRARRPKFRREVVVKFVGLVKETTSPSFFAPADPEAGPGKTWVDAWLRVDLRHMEKQLPYQLHSFYVELMGTTNLESAQQQIVRSSTGREELLLMGLQQIQDHSVSKRSMSEYPVPAFDTVIPAARHLGYVYEWAGMALMTFLIGVVLQLRRPKV